MWNTPIIPEITTLKRRIAELEAQLSVANAWATRDSSPPVAARDARLAELEVRQASDNDLWHIAGVVAELSGGSLFNVSQHKCVTAIRASFMDPDSGRAFLAAAPTSQQVAQLILVEGFEPMVAHVKTDGIEPGTYPLMLAAPVAAPAQPTQTAGRRDYDVEQSACTIESTGDMELAGRLRHAWKNCVTQAQGERIAQLEEALSDARSYVNDGGGDTNAIDKLLADSETPAPGARQPEPICELWGVWFSDPTTGNSGWVGRSLVGGIHEPALFWPKENAERNCLNECYQPRKIRLMTNDA